MSRKEFKEMLTRAEVFRGHKDERLRLLKMKSAALEIVKRRGRKDPMDPDGRKEAADAALTLSLVDAREAELQVPAEEFQRLDELQQLEESCYNDAVLAARERALEELVASQQTYFSGDKAACREFLERLRPPHPYIEKFRRAFGEHPTGQIDHRDKVREIDAFVAHRARYNAEFNLGLD